MKLTKKIIAGFVAFAALALLAGCSNDYSIVEYENGSTWDGEKLANTIPSTTYTLAMDGSSVDEFFTLTGTSVTSGYVKIKTTTATVSFTTTEANAVVSCSAQNQGTSEDRALVITSSTSKLAESDSEVLGYIAAPKKDGSATTVSLDITIETPGTYYVTGGVGELRLLTLSVKDAAAPDPRF